MADNKNDGTLVALVLSPFILTLFWILMVYSGL